MANGYIKSWRRDRGFGFINVEGRDTDVFVHISELRSLGRPPRVGDEINFEIETQENGKIRAINCTVEGENNNSPQTNNVSNSNSNNNPGPIPNIAIYAIIGIVIIALGLYFLLT